VFTKLSAFFALFRKGSALADCAKSGDKAAIAGAIVGVLLAVSGIAAAFGYSLQIDSDTIQAVGTLGASLAVLWINGWHVAANPAIGLPPAQASGPADPRPAEQLRPTGAVPPPPRPGKNRINQPAGDGEPTPPPFTG